MLTTLPIMSLRRLRAWAVLCLLAALLLYGICFLDTVLAGHSVTDTDPFPYASADAVRYELRGMRYLYQGSLLTGPHLGYPLVLSVLAVNTALLWGARSWGAPVKQMLHVSVAALLVTLGLGWPMLAIAQKQHNTLLSRSPQHGASVRASPAVLHVRQCVKRQTEGPCLHATTLNFPNPTAWGLAGLLLTGLAGLQRRGTHPVRVSRPA
ncbi:hypothetical protein DEDE109153_10500 [Deinococcus deserti]